MISLRQPARVILICFWKNIGAILPETQKCAKVNPLKPRRRSAVFQQKLEDIPLHAIFFSKISPKRQWENFNEFIIN